MTVIATGFGAARQRAGAATSGRRRAPRRALGSDARSERLRRSGRRARSAVVPARRIAFANVRRRFKAGDGNRACPQRVAAASAPRPGPPSRPAQPGRLRSRAVPAGPARLASACVQTLLRTPLYDRHVALGARMVPFAGWEMPVQYEGVIPEHRAVRDRLRRLRRLAHGRARGRGPARARAAPVAALERPRPGRRPARRSTRCSRTSDGGIVDDLIVYQLDEHRYLLIVNASNSEADFDWLKEREHPRLRRARRLRRVRAARRAGAAIARAARAAATRPPFTFEMGEIDGIECMVNRTGYTGEHGVELLVHGRGRRRALGRGGRARRDARAGSARATRSASRSATRCTATTSARRPTRSRPASAGSARSTRSSPASRSCARVKARGPEREARRVRHGGEGDPAPGHGDRRGRRGDLGHALADARRRASAWATSPPTAAAPGTEITIDVRGRPRRARSRQEADLQREEDYVAAAESYPDDLKYHREHDWARDRGRRGDARHHLVRPGLARRARPLRAARGRARRSRRTARTARSSRSRPSPT